MRRKKGSANLRAASIIMGLVVLSTAGGVIVSRLWKTPPSRVQPPPHVVIPPPSDPAKPTLPPFDPNHFEEIGIRSQNRRVPVIMYHDVIKRRGRGSVWFDITVEELKEQLDYFAEQGAVPITLADLHEHLTRGKEIPEKSIVLTFDDNYQGFYDNAYPLLKEKKIPSSVFVHTDYVGDKKGDHPHMDWETLKLLDKEGLVTIGSHTLSHPDDITKLSVEKQSEELTKSKSLLEQQLGHPVPYFAYPDGKNDSTTRELTKAAGYTMAFTIVNGQAEESPGILSINRYIHTRYKKAWETAQEAITAAPATLVEKTIKPGPVRLEIEEHAGVKLGMVRGGTPTSIQPPERKSVGLLVQDAKGVAGINGTFFADASLKGISNLLIGPSQTQTTQQFIPETDPYHLRVITNRPAIIWGPTKFVIVPFQPAIMNSQDGVKSLMPDFTDMFVAGSWIVHAGVARDRETMDRYGVKDAKDPRKRAFLGITADGELVLGATIDVVTTEKMAKAAADAGVEEAVLLDSGFSTSLVYNDKVIVTGHTAEDIPSRPVPHAIVLMGDLAPVDKPDLQAFLNDAASALVAAHDEDYYRTHRSETSGRKKRRKRKDPSDDTANSSRTDPSDSGKRRRSDSHSDSNGNDDSKRRSSDPKDSKDSQSDNKGGNNAADSQKSGSNENASPSTGQ